MRFALNRHLQVTHNFHIVIIKDDDFRDANISFRAAMKDLKRVGKGSTEHYPEIKENDLKVIYSSEIMQLNTPVHLQNKVQFYFTRRGGENMHEMTKDTFGIKAENGREFIYKKVDELNKKIVKITKSLHQESSHLVPETHDAQCFRTNCMFQS